LTLEQWNARHVREREAPYSRALGHLWADDIEGALFYMRKAVDVDPSNARAWMQLGFTEGKAGLGAQRIRSYRKAIEVDPGLEGARYLLGVSLLMSGDREGAEEQHKALVRLRSASAVRLKSFLDALHVDEIDRGKVKHRHSKSA
jgi:Flp pilus assembly protein TadD